MHDGGGGVGRRRGEGGGGGVYGAVACGGIGGREFGEFWFWVGDDVERGLFLVGSGRVRDRWSEEFVVATVRKSCDIDLCIGFYLRQGSGGFWTALAVEVCAKLAYLAKI